MPEPRRALLPTLALLTFAATAQAAADPPAAPAPAPLAAPVAAAPTAPTADPTALTPERVLDRRQLGDLQAAPGTGRLAFAVAEPAKEHGPLRHVWTLDPGSRALRQLTRSEKSEWRPRWSPDGRSLAFLSNRSDPAQVWLLPMDGGEALPATASKTEVTAFEWSPDGKRIAYLAAEAKSDAQEAKEKDKDDARVVDRDDRPERLWLADLPAPGAPAAAGKQLTHAPWKIAEMQWTPDGRRLIADATDHPESDRMTDRIVSIAVDNGELRALAQPAGPFALLRVSPDGRSLAYLGSREDGPAPHDLWSLPLDGGAAARNLTAKGLDRSIEGFQFRPDGSLVLLAETGFTSRLYAVDPAGTVSPLSEPTEPATSPYDFALLPDGRIALLGDRTAEAAEVWLWKPGQPAEKATSLNASWAGVPVGSPEILRYRSFDGQTIEAQLLKPAGFVAGRRVPLVVLVHGGPTGRWRDRFEPWGQLLRAKGYAVLYPNIRGSSGYGFRFLASNRKDWGGGDFKDVMAGVDAAVAAGIADPDRLGIGGWSYGGYMAAWAITQTHRFKAAVAGAGLSDLASEFGTENGPAYDEWFYGLPYEHPEGFAKSSPITWVRNARTPTLILQGEDDDTDPIGQSQQLYRALKRYEVPSDLVLYPREGHGLREEKHQLDRMRRIVAWYEKYLKP